MDRIRLWLLPAAVVIVVIVSAVFLTVTEAGKGLVGLATGTETCEVLEPGTPITGTLSTDNVYDCYKFLADGTTYGADDITLKLTSTSGLPFDADIYAPGKTVTEKNTGFKWITTKDTTEKKDTFTLDKDKGDYQVKVWSYAHDVGDYTFSFVITEPLQPEKPTAENQKVESAACTTIMVGTSVVGTIDASNKFDCYSFDAKEGDDVVVVLKATDSTALDADMYAPGKQLTGGNTGYKWVTTSSASPTGEITHKLDKGDGTYQVKAWSYNNEHIGSYELTVKLDASSASASTPSQPAVSSSAETCASISVGTTVSGDIASSDKYDCYTYAGTSGETLTLEITSVDGSALDADMFDPSVTVDEGSAGYAWVTSTGKDKTVKNIVLDKGDGTYTIKAWSFNHANVGGYELKITSDVVKAEPVQEPAAPVVSAPQPSTPVTPSQPATTTPEAPVVSAPQPSTPVTPSQPATTTPAAPATPVVPAPVPVPVAKPAPTYVIKDGESITGNPGVLLTGERGIGEIKTGTSQDKWSFTGTKGDHVSLVLSAESSSLMPAVTLMSNKEVLTWSEGVLRGNAVVDDIILPETRNYTILAHSGRETTGKYELALTITREETIKPLEKIRAKLDANDLCTPTAGDLGEGIEIAIIDTGVDSTHPDLDDLDDDPSTDDPKLVRLDYTSGWDVVPWGNHGTQVAGRAAGTGQSPSSAPGACVWSMKAKGGQFTFSEPVVKGLQKVTLGADEQPGTGDEPDVVSITLGDRASGNGLNPEALMVDFATNSGLVVANSAGNGGPNFYTLNSIGTNNYGITVGNLNQDNSIAPSSSRGPTHDLRIKPDLVAPGQNLILPVKNGGYEVASGTSFSAPYTAGVAALVVQKHPEWTPEMVKAALMNTATPLEGYRLVTQGAGSLNKDRAVSAEVLALPPSLSFGQLTTSSEASREISIVNTGSSAVTVDLSAETKGYEGKSFPWSHPAFSSCERWTSGDDISSWLSSCRQIIATSTLVQVEPKSVTIQPGQTAKVMVKAGGFSDSDPSGFYEGRVFANLNGTGTITVPYIFHHESDVAVYSDNINMAYAGPAFICGETLYMQSIIGTACSGQHPVFKKKSAEKTSVKFTDRIPFYPTGEDKIAFSALVAGTSGISVVEFHYSLNGVQQEPIVMLDDGKSGDIYPGDHVYGVELGPFESGTSISYTVSITGGGGMKNTPGITTFEVIKPFERTADVLLVGNAGNSGYRAHVFKQVTGGGNAPLFHEILMQDLGIKYDTWNTIKRGIVPDWVLHNYVEGGVVVVSAPGMSNLHEGNFSWLKEDGTKSHSLKSFLDKGGNLFISGDGGVGGDKFFTEYLGIRDPSTGHRVEGLFGTDNDLIGDSLQFSIDPSRGGVPMSSLDPTTWDPNPFYIQRMPEKGSSNYSYVGGTEFEPVDETQPIATYDASAIARISGGGLMKLDSCGSILDQFDLPDDHFGGPRDVAVGPNGSIYVLDTMNHKLRIVDPVDIKKYTTFTDYLYNTVEKSWGYFGIPRDMEVDSDGNIYLLTSTDRIYKLNTTGELITMWGGCGFDDGKMWNPQKLVIDENDEIYVLDKFRYDYGGALIGKFHSRVHVFDKNGNFLRKWGSKGSDAYQEATPSSGALKVNPEHIYKPGDIAIDANGDVLVTDMAGMNGHYEEGGVRNTQTYPTVIRFSKSGDYKGTPVLGFSDVSQGNHNCPNLLGGYDLEVDSFGNFYFLGSNGNVRKFDSSGKFIDASGHCYLSIEGKMKVGWPEDLSVLDDGTIFSAEISGPAVEGAKSIKKYLPDGSRAMKEDGKTKLDFGSLGDQEGELGNGFKIHTDEQENVYVIDAFNRKIIKFDSKGLFEWEIKSNHDIPWSRIGHRGSDEGKFNTPNGISIDSFGNVYVADTRNNRIQKFDSAGSFIKSWGKKGSGQGEFYLPHGIGVSGDGHVYVADTWNRRIQKFDLDGNFLLEWSSNPANYESPHTNGPGPYIESPEGAFSGGYAYTEPAIAFPKDIAVDVDGNVLVTEIKNDAVPGRVQKFTSDGILIDPFDDYRSGVAPLSISPVWSCGPGCGSGGALSYMGVATGPGGRVITSVQHASGHSMGIEVYEENYGGKDDAVFLFNRYLPSHSSGMDADQEGNIYVTTSNAAGSFGSGTAGNRYDSGDYRTVFLGFGLERIQSRLERQQLFSRSLRWLGIDVGPIPQTPRNGNIVQTGRKVTFRWDPIEGSRGYLLEIRKSGYDSSYILSESVDGTEFGFVPDGGTGWYFWRVKSRQDDHSESLWSTSRRFKVVSPAYELGKFATSKLELTQAQIDYLDGSGNLLQVHKNGIDGVEGINKPKSIVASPDGKYVYVAGSTTESPNIDRVSRFEVDASTGLLKFSGILSSQNEDGDDFRKIGSLRIDASGKYLYALAQWGKEDNCSYWDTDHSKCLYTGSVVVFDIDSSTGEIKFLSSVKNGVDGVEGLPSPFDVFGVGLLLSPDEKNLYATSVSDLVSFSRDSTNGNLTFLGVHKSDDDTGGLIDMGGYSYMAASPDGEFIYVAGSYADQISVFKRNVETGVLEFSKAISGTGNVYGISITPDGKYLYAMVPDSWGKILVFEKDVNTGEFVKSPISVGSQENTDIAISGDGKYLYTTGSRDVGSYSDPDQIRYSGALFMHEIDSATGDLKVLSGEINTLGGITGLGVHISYWDQTNIITLSPEGDRIYLAGAGENSVVVFKSLKKPEDFDIAKDHKHKVPESASSILPGNARFGDLISTKSGKLSAFYSASDVVYSISSFDQGVTWETPLIITRGYGPQVSSHEDGTLVMFYTRDAELNVRLSDDEGVSWTKNMTMKLPVDQSDTLYGKQFQSGDTFNWKFEVLKSGRWILFYTNEVYKVLASDDNGKTWDSLSELPVPEKQIESDPRVISIYGLVEALDGRLLILAHVRDMVNTKGTLTSPYGLSFKASVVSGGGYSLSDDGGITWSEFLPFDDPTPIMGFNTGPGWYSGSSLVHFDSLDIASNDSGQIFVVADSDYERSIWYKEDEFDSFSGARMRRFSPYVGRNQYPLVTDLPDGSFGIIWRSGASKQDDGNFNQIGSMKYAVIDHIEDVEAPPVIGEVYSTSCLGNHNCPLDPVYHTPGNVLYRDKVEFKVKVADQDNIDKVEVLWSLNGVEQTPMKLIDTMAYNKDRDVWDRRESDKFGTRVYGGKFGPFGKGVEIFYQIAATDSLGHTSVRPVNRFRINIPAEEPFIREVDLSGIAANGDDDSDYNDHYWGASHNAIDSKGNLFVVATVHDRLGNPKDKTLLKKFDSEGLLVKTLSRADLNMPESYKQHSHIRTKCGPHDVAVDGQDNVYLTSNCSPSIYKFTNDVVFIETIEPEETAYSATCAFDGGGGGIIEIDKNSGAIYLSHDHPSNPGSSSSGYGFTKVTADGKCDREFAKKVSSLKSSVLSIAVDETGNVHVVHDAGFGWSKKAANNIHTYAKDGTLLVKWGLTGDKDEEFIGSGGHASSYGNVVSIAASKNGFLYTVDSGKNEIKKFTLDGKFVSKWEGKSVGKKSPKDGFFSSALDISIGPGTGNIYITDSCNKYDCRKHKKRIQVFNPF